MSVCKSLEIKLFVCILFISVEAWAQSKALQLFSIDKEQELNYKALRSKSAVRILNYNQEVYQHLKSSRPAVVNMIVPGVYGDVEVELIENQVLSPDFVLSTDKMRNIPYSPGLYYKGKIKGQDHSLVVLNFFDTEVMGVLSVKDQSQQVIGRNKYLRRNSFIIMDEAQMDSPAFECQVDDQPEWKNHIPKALENRSQAAGCIDVYFEVGYSVFQARGGLNGAADFVSAIFSGTASLYGAEDVSTSLSEMKVWTSEEPYGTGLGYSSSLGAVNGDLVHYVRMASGNSASGIAYLPGLCGSKYAYSEFFNNEGSPTYSWNVNVVTHEMGHNLGSNHTQWCGWQLTPTTKGAIDGCVTQEGGCGQGPIPPKGGGTIMSYCHTTGVGINFANGFGLLPGNAIRAKVNSASCIGSCSGSGAVTPGGGGNNNPPADPPSGGGGTQPDLQITSFIISPSVITSASQTSNISFVTNNKGGALATPSSTRIYYSLDNTLSPTDQTVATISISSLAANTGTSSIFNFNLDQSTPPGTYHFIVCADVSNAVTESVESNNCATASITISNTPPPPTTSPDLVLAINSTVPAILATGSTLNLNGLISNSGTAASVASTVKAVLSKDNAYSSDDQSLYASNVAALAIGANQSFVTDLNFNSTVTAGSYFLIVCADASSANAESNEANNCKSFAINITVNKPDLLIHVQSITPTTIPTGQSCALQFVIRNGGAENATTSKANVYYSLSNNGLGSDDTVLTEIDVPALNIGSVFETATSITKLFKPGTYYITVCADTKNQVLESNESNNCSSSKLTVTNPLSDLLVEKWASPSEFILLQGQPINIRIKNAGIKASEATTAQIRLSDQLTSIVLASIQIPSLNINSTFDTSFYFLPDKEDLAGLKSISLCIDPANTLQEISDGNNCATASISIVVPLPDLKNFTAVSFPDLPKGARFNCPISITNSGRLPAGLSETEIYLSSKPLLKSSGSFKVAIDTVQPMAVGDTTLKLLNLKIPDFVTPGTYYLNICLDYNNKIKEASEINNCQSIRFVVRKEAADIAVTSFKAIDSTFEAGQTIKINLQMANLGELALSPTPVSIKSIVGSDTTFLPSFTSRSLSKGEKADTMISYFIPLSLGGKNIKFEIKLDPLNQLIELNKTNNISSFQFTASKPLPDISLVILENNLPASLYADESYPISFILRNNVVGASDSVHVELKLADTSTQTVFKNKILWSPIQGLHQDTVIQLIHIPSLDSGQYILTLCADPEMLITETDESNNSSSIGILVKEKLADLTITDIKLTDTLYRNVLTKIRCSVKNTGLITVRNLSDKIYISTDKMLDQQDTEIGSVQWTDLLPNVPQNKEVTITVPGHLNPGNYFILFSLDQKNTITEYNELNNSMVQPIVVPIHKADLNNTGLVIFQGALHQNETIELKQLLANQGETTAPSFDISLNLYKHKDDLTPSFTFPAFKCEHALAPGASAEIKYTFKIPDTIPTGTYYLISCIDPGNHIDEMVKANNCGLILVKLESKASLSTAVRNEPLSSNIKAYPNPTSQWITLTGTFNQPVSDLHLILRNEMGKMVRKQIVKGRDQLSQMIDVSELPTGWYVIEIVSNKGSWRQTFIKI